VRQSRAVELRVAGTLARPNAWTWYVLSAATWFLAVGLNGVIIPGLVTQELHGGPGAMAIAQMSGQVPTLLLILLGGAVADRADRRALLVGLYACAAVLTGLLAARVGAGQLSLAVVVAYVSALGVVAAFQMPARDALLSDVAGGDLLRAISLLTMVQWGMQTVGNFGASLGQAVGFAPILAGEVGLVACSAFACSRLPPHVRHGEPGRAITLAELGEGVLEVARSPVLRLVAGLATALGVLFIGPFLVAFPLLVRDFYHGDKVSLSMFLGCFPLGVITTTLALLARGGGLRRKGLAQLAALGGGAVCMIALGCGPPFAGALAAVFVFGLGGALFMTASRTLFQTHAPPAHRGRVLSVYSLATMGASGLIGAPLSGLLLARLGVLATCRAAGVTMAALIVLLSFSKSLRELE